MALLVPSAKVFASAQEGDRIIIGGLERELLSTPLAPYLSANLHLGIPIPIPQSSGNMRGYVATWQLDDEKLLLVRVSGTVGTIDSRNKLVARRPLELRELFPNREAPIFADWFTGVLRVAAGRLIHSDRIGFSRAYEAEWQIKVERGVVVNWQVLDHTSRLLKLCESRKGDAHLQAQCARIGKGVAE
jgi:hypothetical protein